MKNINEELQRILYLTNHKRGVVLSEQEVKGVENRPKSDVNVTTDAPDWNGGSSGELNVSNFAKDSTGVLVNATNVGYKNELYNLAINRSIGKDLPYTIGKVTQPTTFKPDTGGSFEFIGKSFPYPDNMVTPQITKNKESESLIYYIAENIIGFINNKSKFNIKIQGFADSARPTRSAPAGYTRQQLFKDHQSIGCNRLYCGEKDDSLRNIWLADNRAKKMGKFLVGIVKQKTKIDITDSIEYLEPVSSYSPGVKQDQRIGKRSVKVDIKSSDFIEIPKPPTPGEVQTITFAPEPVIGTIDFDGTIINVIKTVYLGDYVKIFAEKNDKVTSLIGNKIPNLSEPGKLNGKTTVNGNINNNEIIVDGISWGTISEIKDNEGMYANIKYSTQPNKICFVGDYDNKIELGTYSIILQLKSI